MVSPVKKSWGRVEQMSNSVAILSDLLDKQQSKEKLAATKIQKIFRGKQTRNSLNWQKASLLGKAGILYGKAARKLHGRYIGKQTKSGTRRKFLGRAINRARSLRAKLHKYTLGSARSRTGFGKGVNAVKGFFGARAGNAGVLLGRAREGLGGLGRGIASGFGALKGLFTRRATSAKKQ